MPPRKQATRDQIAARRARLATFVVGGVRGQARLAKLLEVSLGTVNGDLKWLRNEWQARHVEDVDFAMQADLERSERAAGGLMPGVQRGDPASVNALTGILGWRQKTYGYGATPTLDLTTGGQSLNAPVIREVVIERAVAEDLDLDGTAQQPVSD